MTRAAVDLTNEARADTAGVCVAGSLPPLRTSYEPKHPSPVSMTEEYAEIAEHLAPGVDLLAELSSYLSVSPSRFRRPRRLDGRVCPRFSSI